MSDAESRSRFPHTEPIEIAGYRLSAAEIVAMLGPQLTDRRRERIDTVLSGRTYNVTTVFDGPYDRGNVSAVMRTAEGLGYQSVHVIETQEDFKPANRVTQGADKWLDTFTWDRPTGCLNYLAERDYQIVATELEASRPIDEIDFSRPTALIFGNERDGVSEEVLEAADARCIIPMPGFSQSFNISVAAAITLYHIYRDRLQRIGRHGDLSDDEREILRAIYYLRSANSPERLIRNMLDRRG